MGWKQLFSNNGDIEYYLVKIRPLWDGNKKDINYLLLEYLDNDVKIRPLWDGN